MNITLEQHIDIYERFLVGHPKCIQVEDMMAYELLDEIPGLECDLLQLDNSMEQFPNIKDKQIIYISGISEIQTRYGLHSRILTDNLFLHTVERNYE